MTLNGSPNSLMQFIAITSFSYFTFITRIFQKQIITFPISFEVFDSSWHNVEFFSVSWPSSFFLRISCWVKRVSFLHEICTGADIIGWHFAHMQHQIIGVVPFWGVQFVSPIIVASRCYCRLWLLGRKLAGKHAQVRKIHLLVKFYG